MAYEIKNGQGTAFKNDKYEKGSNQPYAKGKIKTPEGKEYDITLWIPKSEKLKGFNITVQEPYQGNSQNGESQSNAQGDDLPW